MFEINLVDVDKKNYEIVLKLFPGQEGTKHISSNAEILVEALFDDKINCVKAIQIIDVHGNDTLIGLFFAYPCNDDLNRIWIETFMIDVKYQGKGFGKKAFNMALEHLEKNFDFDRIELSTSNPISVNLYKQFGFKFIKNDDRARQFYRKWKEYMMVKL